MPKNGEFGWLCDPKKNTECSKKHCYWTAGGECKITDQWEYATDGEQKKYPKDSKLLQCRYADKNGTCKGCKIGKKEENNGS